MTQSRIKKNFTEGPLFLRMIAFAIPLMLSGVLQVGYNMADNIIVGQFSGDPDALGAVGSASPLTTLLINALFGISAGAGIVIAQAYGAKDEERVSRAAHTTMVFSVIAGIAMMTVGLIFSRPLLIMMGTNDELLDKAVLYMTIICLGAPASSVYNYGASILRATGDSKTSLYILSISGLANVLFNLVFVLAFGMSVGGVALATTISKYISAVWVVAVLFKRKESCYGLKIKLLRIDRELLSKIVRLGLPIAFQNVIFNLSGVIVTGAVNTLPKHTISAKTIAFNIEGITNTCMNAFVSVGTTFTAQNYGAKKYGRMNKVLLYSLLQVSVIGLAMSWIEIGFGRELAMLYIDAGDLAREAIIKDVLDIFKVMLSVYFLCGVLSTLSGILKGVGYSLISVLASLLGVGVRVVWLLFVSPTPRFHNVLGVFIAYPISWLITIIILAISCVYAWRKLGISKGARQEKLAELKEN